MDIKKLIEELDIINKNGYKYAQFDVEELYNSIVPKEHGFIYEDEIKQVEEFLGLTGEESFEELTAIRNTIVRYWADYADKFYEIPKKERTEEEIDEFDKMQDQMSAFTAVIDSLKWNLKPVQEAIKMNIKQLTESIQQVLEDTDTLEEPIWQLEEYLGNQMDANGFDWKRENNIVYFTKDNKQVEYDAEAHPVPLITSKIDGKVVNQRQIISRFDIDKIIDDVVE